MTHKAKLKHLKSVWRYTNILQFDAKLTSVDLIK